MRKAKLYASLCVFGLLFAGVARADSIFTLNVDGCTGGCGTGPYGTIDLAQSGSNVIVTETLDPGYVFVSSGAGDALEFNATTGTIDSSSITTGFSIGPAPDSASTFGSFLKSITCSGCGNGGSSPLYGPLMFTVDNTLISDFIQNSKGYYFASDIGELSSGNMLPVVSTGNVGSDGGTPVIPEPPSLLLLGTGLALLAGAFKMKLLTH